MNVDHLLENIQFRQAQHISANQIFFKLVMMMWPWKHWTTLIFCYIFYSFWHHEPIRLCIQYCMCSWNCSIFQSAALPEYQYQFEMFKINSGWCHKHRKIYSMCICVSVLPPFSAVLQHWLIGLSTPHFLSDHLKNSPKQQWLAICRPAPWCQCFFTSFYWLACSAASW